MNTIGPTFIDTPLTRPFWNDKAFHAEVVGRIKLGRLGTVQDLMGAVVFLASDAAALVTGTSLVVDGGWTRSSRVSIKTSSYRSADRLQG